MCFDSTTLDDDVYQPVWKINSNSNIKSDSTEFKHEILFKWFKYLKGLAWVICPGSDSGLLPYIRFFNCDRFSSPRWVNNVKNCYLAEFHFLPGKQEVAQGGSTSYMIIWNCLMVHSALWKGWTIKVSKTNK